MPTFKSCARDLDYTLTSLTHSPTFTNVPDTFSNNVSDQDEVPSTRIGNTTAAVFNHGGNAGKQFGVAFAKVDTVKNSNWKEG